MIWMVSWKTWTKHWDWRERTVSYRWRRKRKDATSTMWVSRSCSFCGVPVQGGLGIVLQLIRQFDEVLTSYHKEVYYDPAIPHGTIGSCVSDLSFLAKKYSVYGNEYKGGEETTDTEVEVSVDSVFLSIGNKTFRIPLDSWDLALFVAESSFHFWSVSIGTSELV